jgi:peptide methionine sulfoxide reductase msrA/msrB
MKNTINLIIFLLLFFCSCANSQSKKTTQNKDSMQLKETEWKEKLSDEQYYILREKGTERPFTGKLLLTKDKGTYKCAACSNELFTDDMKFESHCGWPSFDKEIAGGKIKQIVDNTHGMKRTEIICAKCGGHLGHIFDDGPTETGKRYCVNSVSLQFEPANAPVNNTQEITLAGGCFWCIEAIFSELKGVTKVESGYSGGPNKNPTYKEVCSGNTGHAEVVNITFNTKEISLEEILEVFFTLHNPTTLNQQGADVGTQYRSAIFYHNNQQKEISEKIIAKLNTEKVFEKPIVTEVTAFTEFYKAENYHQEYYELNKEQPYCKMVILPKMEKLHKVFATKLKTKN